MTVEINSGETGKLEILVVENTLKHQVAARKMLEKHNIRIVDTFDSAIDYLSGKNKEKYDVLLTDLFYTQGEGRMVSNHVSGELPFGFPLALIALKEEIPFIGIVTDMNHHQHPLAYTFDFLKKPVRTEKSTLMFFDERDLNSLYLLKNGKFCRYDEDTCAYPLNEIACLEDLDTDYIKREIKDNPCYPDGFGYQRKKETFALDKEDGKIFVKNWRAALEKLVKPCKVL